MKKVSKHFKKVALISAIGLAFGFSQSGLAGTATGTITVTGNAVAACSVSSMLVDAGPVIGNQSFTTTITFQPTVTCANLTNWSLSAPTTNPLSVGTNVNNKVVLLNHTFQNVGLVPEVGVGTGGQSILTLYVRLSDTTGTQGLVGTGPISGTIPITLTF